MDSKRIIVTAVSIAVVGVFLLAASYRFELTFREGAQRIRLNCYFECLQKCSQVTFPSLGTPSGTPISLGGPSCSDACKENCKVN